MEMGSITRVDDEHNENRIINFLISRYKKRFPSYNTINL